MEEKAQATDELIAELTEHHSKQVEALIKANSEAMEKLTKEAHCWQKQQNRLRRRKMQQPTPTVITFNINPNCNHEQRWELLANSAKHPANWKGFQ